MTAHENKVQLDEAMAQARREQEAIWEAMREAVLEWRNLNLKLIEGVEK